MRLALGEGSRDRAVPAVLSTHEEINGWDSPPGPRPAGARPPSASFEEIAMLTQSRSFLRRLSALVRKRAAPADWPTVLHVTHPKAGSQWLHKILRQCAPERAVTPQYAAA